MVEAEHEPVSLPETKGTEERKEYRYYALCPNCGQSMRLVMHFNDLGLDIIPNSVVTYDGEDPSSTVTVKGKKGKASMECQSCQLVIPVQTLRHQ